MRNIRITSLLLIATLTLGIAGCSEGNSINPANSDEAVRTSISVSSDETTVITRETDETVATTKETNTEKSGIRINTDLLDEFGMTFGELEKKTWKCDKRKN